MTTLTGDSTEPAELRGYGPIPAGLARAIAADPTSTWTRLVTDATGQVRDYGTTRYRPPADLDRFVRARDLTCTFPHCHRPATSADLDHIVDWAQGGPTNAANLAAVCSRHHHAKHDGGWTYCRDPITGDYRWTSPTGHGYTRPPPEPHAA